MKISIIVCIFNSGKYLEKNLNSIKQQSFENFECLMINDGSTDDSEEICLNFQKNDERFVLYNKENGGALDTANYGIDRAKGDYVTFLDADDYADDGWLQNYVNILNNNDVDTVFCGYRAVDKNYSERLIEIPNYEKKLYYGSEKSIFIERLIGYSCEDLYKKLGKHPEMVIREFGAVWRFIYKNETLQKYNIRFQKGCTLVGDTLVNSEYISLCKGIYVSKKHFVNYQYRNDGVVQSSLHQNAIDFCKDKMRYSLAREISTKKIKDNMGRDFSYAWEGSNIFSAIEIGLRLSGEKNISFQDKIKLFKKYLYLNSTKKALKHLKIRKIPCKYIICFIPLKLHAYVFEFFILWMAQKVGINPPVRG